MIHFYEIGQKVSWEKNICPFHPDVYSGEIVDISDSIRYPGEDTISIQTDISIIYLSTLDPEFEFLT